MTIEYAIALFQNLILTSFTLILPILASAIVIGLTVSILQTVTSIQEQTLVFVPKLLGVGIVIVFLADWLLSGMLDYTRETFLKIAEMAL